MKAALARAAYSTLLRLATPLYLLRLLWRGRREPLYRRWFGERLGFAQSANADTTGRLWLHAVSLGETRAAEALIDELRRQHPPMRLLLTHGTATGREAGATLLREGDAQAWLPYDTPGAVRRFLAAHRPQAGVIMETEIWPNLLHEAARAGVPLVLANARLSERSLRKGQSLAALMRPAAACLSMALAQTEADARRLREAGVREVRVLGNLKFDMAPSEPLHAAGRVWREALARPVVLLAVSREGEEAPMLAAWQRLALQGVAGDRRAAGPGGPLLLIVPRHPQRFDEVAALVGACGLTLARRSAWGPSLVGPLPADAAQADVWLGDSMREMPLYYGAAQIALLGGSFAPLGGQNLIEAAACGCPVLMGLHTFNFAQAAELALAAGAARRAGSMREAVALACEPLTAAERRERIQHCLAFAAQHRGAAQRMAERIATLL